MIDFKIVMKTKNEVDIILLPRLEIFQIGYLRAEKTSFEFSKLQMV